MSTIRKQTTSIQIERYGLESVPEKLRTTSWYEYAMIQMTVSVNAGNFLVPALAVLEGGLSFIWAVLSTILGATIAFLFVSYLSFPGARRGIPSQYAVRSFVGIKGAQYFASPVRTITSLYWFAVQTIGGTYMVVELMKRAFNFQLQFLPTALFLAAVMAALALVGFDAVKKATKYFLPLLFAGGVAMFFVYFTTSVEGNHYSSILSMNEQPDLSSFLFFSSLAFVQYVSGVSSSSDMARYAKSTGHAFWGIFSGNTIGFTLTALLGAYTAAVAGTWNPFLITSQQTNSTLLLILIFASALCSMIMINISNAYTGGYSLLNTFPSLGRVRSALLLGCAAILLSSFPEFVDQAETFISFLGAFVIPLSAVIISDFIVVKKGRFTTEMLQELSERTNTLNRPGFVAIGSGLLLYLLLPTAYSPGFLSFIVTSIVYLVSRKAMVL
ncbi:cytosine permease [Alkalihalobacillus macyae]|uniref:purine-cytosine permease family protein n=1 Tax=Guptibacillus hwajinpoensis TaxID=208199 RepID=UPI00273BCDD0|nr:cytosine permease [Alkalihalobacillus macyae]MDP4550926.1 cytosine permease [Alkalihalobacillus macyae]